MFTILQKVVFKRGVRFKNLSVQHNVFTVILSFRSGLNDGVFVSNDPVNFVDPWGLKPPVDPNRLPGKFRPDSLNNRNVDMVDFRPGGSEDVRGTVLDNPAHADSDLTRQEMTDAGNYNYGYAGAKNGYSLRTLQGIGDYDQYLSGKQGCYFCFPKDNPQDAANIAEGYNDYCEQQSTK